MRHLSELQANEYRVLGGLMEKEQTTPDYYPMTLNALVAACNQKTNRNPVMTLTELDTLNLLRVLLQDSLVERVSSARTDRWCHRVDERLHFRPEWKALLTVLFLRGDQTLGELRIRTERMHPFASLSEVQETLTAMANEEELLVVELPRAPGQKESRWGLAGQDHPAVEAAAVHALDSSSSPFEERLTRLEEEVRELREQLDRLQATGGPGIS